ncbi:MAG: hypothetical protein ACK5PI_01075, partial [Acetobacteraceae bacterium]
MTPLPPSDATLPPIMGRVQHEAPLGPTTWFRVGGPAEWLVRPASLDDLLLLLRDAPPALPVTVIGAASNLIIRDGGVRALAVPFRCRARLGDQANRRPGGMIRVAVLMGGISAEREVSLSSGAMVAAALA